MWNALFPSSNINSLFIVGLGIWDRFGPGDTENPIS
jgi:hypothetical protein